MNYFSFLEYSFNKNKFKKISKLTKINICQNHCIHPITIFTRIVRFRFTRIIRFTRINIFIGSPDLPYSSEWQESPKSLKLPDSSELPYNQNHQTHHNHQNYDFQEDHQIHQNHIFAKFTKITRTQLNLQNYHIHENRHTNKNQYFH